MTRDDNYGSNYCTNRRRLRHGDAVAMMLGDAAYATQFPTDSQRRSRFACVFAIDALIGRDDAI